MKLHYTFAAPDKRTGIVHVIDTVVETMVGSSMADYVAHCNLSLRLHISHVDYGMAGRYVATCIACVVLAPQRGHAWR